MLSLDFIARAADALFADFADVFVARLVRFGFFIAGFGQLHHNEFAVTAVLGVQLHDSVGGGGRAGEEVEDDEVFFWDISQKLSKQFRWFFTTIKRNSSLVANITKISAVIIEVQNGLFLFVVT